MLLKDKFRSSHVTRALTKWDLGLTGKLFDYKKWKQSRRKIVYVGQNKIRSGHFSNEKKYNEAMAMVWGSMPPKEVEKPHFIEWTKDTNKYLDILEESHLLLMKEYLTSGQDYVFQRDGASCHTSEYKNVEMGERFLETLWHEITKVLWKHPAISKLK